MSTWVYLQSEPGLFTVGFYDPSGKWHPHGDFENRATAADEVARLNGGTDAYHDCAESLFAHPVEVCVSPDDDRFGEEPPEVLCKIVRYYDRGDPSVGIDPTDLIVLADDQTGTWIENHLARTRSEAELVQEFREWRKKNAYEDWEGDAVELCKRLILDQQQWGYSSIRQERISWLADFERRWDLATGS